jgi:hypothetical protein
MALRGRPRTNPEAALSRKAEMRMSLREHERLQALWKSSTATSRSEFLRDVVFGYQLRSKTDSATAYQLSRIGNNLNQIARKLNSGWHVDGRDLAEELAALRPVVMDLIRRL